MFIFMSLNLLLGVLSLCLPDFSLNDQGLHVTSCGRLKKHDKKILQVLPSKSRVYLSTPGGWDGLVTFIDQQNVPKMIACKFKSCNRFFSLWFCLFEHFPMTTITWRILTWKTMRRERPRHSSFPSWVHWSPAPTDPPAASGHMSEHRCDKCDPNNC